MAFLTLNGVTVRVSVEGASLAYARVGGEAERSPSGDLEGSPLADKREWTMRTTPVTASEVDAWVGLIEGKGHSFPFDADTYSARGRGTSAGTGTISATAKYGGGSLEVLNLATVSWAIGFGSSWTILAWTNRQDGMGWKHRLLRSDGAEWVDGTLNDLSIGELTVSSGSLVFTGENGSDWLFDDVVALPYVVPDSWVAGLYAQHGGAAWPSLPRVLAAGSFYPSSLTVRGKVTDTRVVRFSSGGALTSGYTLEFTIREV